MPRGRWSVSLDRLAAAVGPVMKQLTPRALVTRLQPPTHDGEDKAYTFIKQFQDVAPESSLLGPAKAYGCAESVEEVFQLLQTKYWTSIHQAKSKLMLVMLDPNSPVFFGPRNATIDKSSPIFYVCRG